MDNYELIPLLWTTNGGCVALYVLFTWFGAVGSFVAPSCGTDVVAVDHHEGFVIIWHSLLAIALSICGTFILRDQRTPIGLGVFVGAVFMMSNFTLCTLFILGGQLSKKKAMETNCKLSGMYTTANVFSLLIDVLLFLSYSALCYALIQRKDTLLSEDGLGGVGNEYTTPSFSNRNREGEEVLTSV